MHRADFRAASSALVLIRDIRRELSEMPAGNVDQALLNAARSGVIALHRHDWPERLITHRELSEGYLEHAGEFYVGASIIAAIAAQPGDKHGS